MNINEFGNNSFVRVKGLKKRIGEAEKEMQMSREIKFRVWDKHYNRWEERPCTINKRGNLFIYNVDSGEWFEPQHTGYDVVWFTGLKDKNGKDLDWWEDDLFRFAGSKVVRQLIYSQGRFVFVLPNGLECACKDTLSWGELPIKISDIHTTPNLLEQENA